MVAGKPSYTFPTPRAKRNMSLSASPRYVTAVLISQIPFEEDRALFDLRISIPVFCIFDVTHPSSSIDNVHY